MFKKPIFMTTVSLSSAVIITTAMSFTQVAFANDTKKMTEAAKQALDERLMKQAPTPASINKELEKKAKQKKEQPLWSDSQKHQAELEMKYKQAIADDPDNKKNYAYLAGLYLQNNKTGKAIDAYQDAISIDPENPKLFAAISIAYLHHSKFAMAKAMADEALRIDPSLKQVEKITEYIVAKQAAIDAASKIPTGDVKSGTGMAPHGSVMPTAIGVKPSDSIHTPKK